ncbi:MAG: SRPBCC family protein [Actinobacteria bacterium]|nr:SRPBCC family protein [Actinomycetota bacterium]
MFSRIGEARLTRPVDPSRTLGQGRAHRVLIAGVALGAVKVFDLLVRGAVPVDLGVGREVRRLGPVSWDIAASPERVFDAVRAPYAERVPRALRGKVEVWERGTDMVLAAHRTPVRERIAVTVETVRFDRPHRIDFRLVRGPVPHVSESFTFEPISGGTRLTWEGELGTDLWWLGRRWGDRVAAVWEQAVRGSVEQVRSACEA